MVSAKSCDSARKRYARLVLIAYAIGTAAVLAFRFTPFAVPCLFLWFTGIPCPACGISRAAVYALQLNVLAALRMNLLFFPLLLGGGTLFVCAVLDAFFGKAAIARFNAMLANKWAIAAAAVLMLVSWTYNLWRWL